MMTRLDYLELQNYLRAKVTDPSLIKKTASIALGFALGRSVHLPSSAVDFSPNYYLQSVRPALALVATSFNEQILVDIDLVEQVTRTYWLKRYANAFPSELIPLSSVKDAPFMSKLSGTTALINPALHEFCEANAELLMVLINRITLVLKSS